MPKEDLKPIVITDFQKGIAPSPHFGIGDMRNIDIWSEPGVAKIAWSSSKKSSTTITGYPRWSSQDTSTSANLYFFDSDNKAYSSTYGETSFANIAGNTQTNGTGDGMIWWKNHLFCIRDTALDVYKFSTTTWYNSWGGYTLTTGGGYHPTLWSLNDDKLYIAHGNLLMSVEAVGTFDANNAATYTVTTSALDLPAGYKIKTVRELGDKIVTGTWTGASIADRRIADIFFWDRSSTTFSDPVRFQENGVNAMIVVAGLLYVQAGVFGNWYVTNGSGSQLFAKMPKKIFDFTGAQYIKVEPDAIFHRDGKIYFGVSLGSGTTLNPLGIWSLDIESRSVTFENQLSTGNTANLKVGTLFSTGSDTFVAGWQDVGSSAQGVDLIGNSYRYTSYAAYLESALYPVGLNLTKRVFTQAHFQLSEPLSTGQGVKIYYRTNTSDSYTLIGTYDYSTLGAVLSHTFTPDIPACEFVQIKCALTTGASSSTTPKLKSIILI